MAYFLFRRDCAISQSKRLMGCESGAAQTWTVEGRTVDQKIDTHCLSGNPTHGGSQFSTDNATFRSID